MKRNTYVDFTQLTFMRQFGGTGFRQNHHHFAINLPRPQHEGQESEEVQSAESKEDEEGEIGKASNQPPRVTYDLPF